MKLADKVVLVIGGDRGIGKGIALGLGREGADIALSDPKVSRKHAEIGLYGPDAWVVRDLASKNGTTLNGRRVDDKTKLKHWDVIQIGDTPIRFAVVEKSIKVA